MPLTKRNHTCSYRTVKHRNIYIRATCPHTITPLTAPSPGPSPPPPLSCQKCRLNSIGRTEKKKKIYIIVDGLETPKRNINKQHTRYKNKQDVKCVYTCIKGVRFNIAFQKENQRRIKGESKENQERTEKYFY